MAENSVPETLDAAEDTMTLVDFLEVEKQLERDANAVLGASDDKNCTYDMGYVPRQALYACMTCTPQDKSDSKPAGLCLACSFHCHEGHELVELYTKRLFRCDCGNSLFKGRKCNLVPEKSELNENNKYNHNFKGVYCTCVRPYPDPEEEEGDDMYQCTVCEDWFHTKLNEIISFHRDIQKPLQQEATLNEHLNGTALPPEHYSEMICGQCTDKLPFLNYYLSHLVKDESKIVDVEGTETTNDTENKDETISDQQNDKPLKKRNITGDTCYLKCNKAKSRPVKTPTYWPNYFREMLCSCNDCKELYNKLDVPWILDSNDTVVAYESKGIHGEPVKEHSRYEEGMKALSQLDRYQQVEAIQNYNELKTNLLEYLAKFAENKKVVTKEDINEFFTQMQAKKRQRLDAPPYNCH